MQKQIGLKAQYVLRDVESYACAIVIHYAGLSSRVTRQIATIANAIEDTYLRELMASNYSLNARSAGCIIVRLASAHDIIAAMCSGECT